MGTSWHYYAFLISWIQCLIVVWFAVTIETQSTDTYSEVNNSSTSDGTSETTQRTLSEFSTIVMPSCPPPDNLNLLCDDKLAENLVTCKERVKVIEICWNKFGGLFYNDSNWSACKSSCEDVVNLLTELGFLNSFVTEPIPTSIVSTVDETTTTLKPTSAVVPVTVTFRPNVTSASVTVTSNSSIDNITVSQPSKVTHIPATGNSSRAPTATVVANSTGSISTISGNFTTIDTPSSMAGGGEEEGFPPLSYVYPLIGGVVILIEVVVLCYLFCYRKKKNGSPVGRYRRSSTGSMVIQEDVLEPETTSPTQALCNGPGPAFTDEMVLEEDKHIFRSYLNLRYIDDTSTEGTPEKVLIK